MPRARTGGFGTDGIAMSQDGKAAPARRAEKGKSAYLNEADQRRLVKEKFSLLTGVSGIGKLTAAQAQYVALIKLGATPSRRPLNMFVVAKDFLVDPETQSVRNMVRRKGLPIDREVHVDMGTIRAIYDRVRIDNPSSAVASGSGDQPKSVMQGEFIKLLATAADRNASDIHIIVDRYEGRIRMRIDNVVRDYKEMQVQQAQELCSAVFAMTDVSETTYRSMDYQQARLTESSVRAKGHEFPEGVQSVRLQFNPLPSGGRHLVARLLYHQRIGSDADVDELGYTERQIADIRKMRRRTIGINIVCGPTGSGKSTTLQRSMTATLRERPGINLITIEDPPEYIIQGAVQLPVVAAIDQKDRATNFQLAMNATLRSDPDVIMIGEIRDLVSAALAYTAAETGHGVWASLHANSAVAILDRLRDLGLELFKLTDASKFTGLIGQRLVRRINPEFSCGFEEARRHELLAKEDLATLESLAGDRISKVRFAATHLPEDPHQAYRGRTVCAETILLDQRFLDLYGGGRKADALSYWKDDLDGMDMIEHGLALVLSGKVDVRSVQETVGPIEDVSPDRVEKIIELAGLE